MRPQWLVSCSVLGGNDSQFTVSLQQEAGQMSEGGVSVSPGMSTCVTVQCHAK